MTILNLTQHNATKDQQDAGISDLPELYKDFLKKIDKFSKIYYSHQSRTYLQHGAGVRSSIRIHSYIGATFG